MIQTGMKRCPKCKDEASVDGRATMNGSHGFITVHVKGVPMWGCLNCGHTFD